MGRDVAAAGDRRMGKSPSLEHKSWDSFLSTADRVDINDLVIKTFNV